jgi:hypothetical protein
MTLGNMRDLGVQRLLASCLNDACRHVALIILLLVIVISLGQSGAPTASQGLFIHESEQPFPRRDLKVEYQAATMRKMKITTTTRVGKLSRSMNARKALHPRLAR